MTKVQSWTMTGLAVVALAAGILLASGAVSFAQTGTPTSTPSATEDAGDDGTPTPSASDEDADANGDDAEGSEGDDDDSGRRGCGGGKYPIKEAAAEVLGISEDDLIAGLRDQSLAQIAEAQGMSVEDFRAALLENVTADLQARLDAGDITQEQFDEKVAELNANIDEIINTEGGVRFRSGRGSDEEREAGGVRFRRGTVPNFDA
jgi:hypothetical protein